MRFIFLLKGRLRLIKSACSPPMGLDFKSVPSPPTPVSRQVGGRGKIFTCKVAREKAKEELAVGHIWRMCVQSRGPSVSKVLLPWTGPA